MLKRIVIKKYENRRLYDTVRSQYVNLDEVAQLVRDGNEVQVLDAATGEDVTRLILTQIIVEHAKSPDSVFPIDLLRQMVMASGRATQESALKYIKAAFDMYQAAFQAVVPGMNPFEFMNLARERQRAAAEQAADSTSGGTGTASPQSSPPPESPEVAELRRRLEELEARVSKPKSRRRNRPLNYRKG